ncbi:MAG: hypothetical protein V6Z81_06305 [Parvularculales bacterium]
MLSPFILYDFFGRQSTCGEDVRSEPSGFGFTVGPKAERPSNSNTAIFVQHGAKDSLGLLLSTLPDGRVDRLNHADFLVYLQKA